MRSTPAPISGHVGVAHTRWATHGVPTTDNAHPHISRDGIAIVHNGIIENHEAMRADLKGLGYSFTSETDTEVIAHRIHHHLAPHRSVRGGSQDGRRIKGRLRLGGGQRADPECVVVAREVAPSSSGSASARTSSHRRRGTPAGHAPLHVLGRRRCRRDSPQVDQDSGRGGARGARAIRESDLPAEAVERGQYRHFMLKEIHEQPRAIAQTLEERVAGGKLLDAAFGPLAQQVFRKSSRAYRGLRHHYHAGLVASYVIEQVCRIPARIEIASEYRFGERCAPPACRRFADCDIASRTAPLRRCSRSQARYSLAISMRAGCGRPAR